MSFTAIVPNLDNQLITVDLSEILDEEIASGRAATDTIATYSSQLKQYFNWCDSNRVNPVFASIETIKGYRRYLSKKKFKISTISTKLTVVRRFYGVLVERGLIATNPAAKVKPPVEKEKVGTSTNFLSLN